MATPQAEDASNTSSTALTPSNADAFELTSSLKELQSEEHCKILDVVNQLRQSGLGDHLSLPQIVVCGDQSSGKSASLEAITGIPFEQSDNLCTRYPTEIHLCDAKIPYLTVRVIPDPSRPAAEQHSIKSFEELISDFSELPRIMRLAKAVMGISNEPDSDAKPRAFARDVLKIEYGSLTSPRLTLVDIPGLIATSTKGVTKADVDMVAEITDHYIKQPRTICLAVVSATNDYSNQRILEKVREVDPDGNRTLGLITKPDGLAAGSARNKDIFFKLGWHVLKNRKFEERELSLEGRNFSETTFFNNSNFKTLPKDSVGVTALQKRLSQLLFEHIRSELPKLKQDLDSALRDVEGPLELLGTPRSTASQCKSYLFQLAMDVQKVTLAAVNGHYENEYFQWKIDPDFSLDSPATICRIRAVVQLLNTQFAEFMEENGRKFALVMNDDVPGDDESSPTDSSIKSVSESRFFSSHVSERISKEQAIEWARQVLIRNRGKELVGNFNPLLIGELFWEQSSKWSDIAKEHVIRVSQICRSFLKTLLDEKCPPDVAKRIWVTLVEKKLKDREADALKELALLVRELKLHPINYNHYYTENITKYRLERQSAALEKSIRSATSTVWDGPTKSTEIDISKVVAEIAGNNPSNMDDYSCVEVLDCGDAIYKVQQKTFIANVTTQVIERHIVTGLENLFEPFVVSQLSDLAVQAMASEPAATKRMRDFYENKIMKLREGEEIFRSVV